MAKNLLYYGDNLEVLRGRDQKGIAYIADESVDLVYLDPPFNSNANYNAFLPEKDGSRSTAQLKAFKDTWTWAEAAPIYRNFVQSEETPERVGEALRAFHKLIGPSRMLAYLTMMAPRLVELRRKLKPTGSLYLHCDPTASHYLKLLLDSIFGPDCFHSEIIWRRSNVHNKLSKQYGPIHDTIFFYTKTQVFHFTPGVRPYMKGYIKAWFTKEDDKGLYRTNMLTGAGTRKGASGEAWGGFDPTSVGRHWAIPKSLRSELPPESEEWSTQETLEFLNEIGHIYIPRDGAGQPKYVQRIGNGVPYQDIWAYQPYTQGAQYDTDEAIDADVRWLEHTSEKLGYPTQKPEGLLSRIINTSCPENGIVLDPFCGCGTTIAAAQKLGRRWIGIDVTFAATNLIKSRLRTAHGDEIEKTYSVLGEPTTLAEAEHLAKSDAYQFQWWVLGLVGGRPVEQKKGGEKGIDGKLIFHDDAEGEESQVVIFSVKAGQNLNPGMVRDLGHVVQRENAAIGVLLTMKEPTDGMRSEAAGPEDYTSPWGTRHPRLQILSVNDLLEGKKVDIPPSRDLRTYKKAPKAGKPRRNRPDYRLLPFLGGLGEGSEPTPED